MGVELFYSDRQASGRTDKHDETTVGFCNFSNAYKNLCQKCYACIFNSGLYKMFLNHPVPITSVVRLQVHVFWGVLLRTVFCQPRDFAIKWHGVTAERNKLYNERLDSQNIIGVCQLKERCVGRTWSMKLKSLTGTIFIILTVNITVRQGPYFIQQLSCHFPQHLHPYRATAALRGRAVSWLD